MIVEKYLTHNRKRSYLIKTGIGLIIFLCKFYNFHFKQKKNTIKIIWFQIITVKQNALYNKNVNVYWKSHSDHY